MASLIREPSRPRKPWRVDWLDRRRRRTRRFATRREAERFIGALADGRHQETARSTLTDWFVTWVQTHGPEWEPRTRKDRASYADRLILPDLGSLRLNEIGRLDVRQWRTELLRRGVTPHVANRAVSVLSAALGAAVEDDLLPANPCRGLPRLPEGAKRREPATLAEVERMRLLLDHLYDARGVSVAENPRVLRDRAVVSLLAYAGLRPSELGALRWDDVRPATLAIRSATGTRGVEKPTKTGSVRTVPVIGPLGEDLERLERSQPLVLGGLDYPNWAARVWRPARAALGTAATPYALRHTFASLLIAEGRTPHEVARLLGHSTPALTLSTYGHLFDEAQLRPNESMEAAVVRARQEALSMARTASLTTPRGGPGRRRGGGGRGAGERGRSSGRIR